MQLLNTAGGGGGGGVRVEKGVGGMPPLLWETGRERKTQDDS